MINIAAIEHRAFDNYCYPLNEDELEINLRTGKDVREVCLLWCDPFDRDTGGNGPLSPYTTLAVSGCRRLPHHLWWTVRIRPAAKRARYFFKICSDNEAYIYGESGIFSEQEFLVHADMQYPFIFPWMNRNDICTPPKWAENTVWYQIFPSRFCHAATEHEVADLLPWAGPDSPVTNAMKFGGNLRGITGQLDYLAELGISGIYMNPINRSASQHKYDTSDYYDIDPEFGTKEDLKALVRTAHKHGIRVMLDGVFNHSGWDFFAWQDLLKNRQNSKYASWYMVNDWNFEGRPGYNARKHRYFSFSYCDTMPKFNTNNPEVRNYLISVCEYWVKEYDIDALRLDVSDEVCHDFCRELQLVLRALKSDFYIIGEVWHNATPWLRGNEFDAIMNYPLQYAIYDFMQNTSRTAAGFEENVNRCLTDYFLQTQKVMFNLLDSHDTMRLVTRLGSKDRALQALALLFCMPGSPCLYYGTEVFLPGGGDPDCRHCMPWKEIAEGRYTGDFAAVQQLIRLRKSSGALRSPQMRFLHDESDDRILILQKDSEDSNERIYLLVNCSEKDFDMSTYRSRGSVLFENGLQDSLLPPGATALIAAARFSGSQTGMAGQG